jgi:ATP-binding cassette subfamily B protein
MSLAYRADPALFLLQFALETAPALLALLSTYAIKLLVDAALAGVGGAGAGGTGIGGVGTGNTEMGGPGAVGMSGAVGVVAAAGVIAGADAVQRIARQLLGAGSIKHQEKVQLLLDRRLMALAGGVPGLEHHERPDYADTLALLRSERRLLAGVPYALALNLRAVIQLVGQPLLLATLHPLLALLPLCGVPSLLAAARHERILRRFREGNGERARTIGHLFDCATRADAGKELRLFGMGSELLGRHRRLSRAATLAQDRAEWWGAALGVAGQLCFAAGYVAAVGFVLWRAMGGAATAGDVALVVTLGAQMGGAVGDAAGPTTFAARALRLARRFLWLADYGEAAHHRVRELPHASVPDRLEHGITLEGVTFRYAGSEEDVLRDVSLHLPAGKVVALVGENGAGKTTLVKLLARFYEPSSPPDSPQPSGFPGSARPAGRILVDGVDLRRLDLPAWRGRISAAFQDFARFEFLVRETVGVGDLARVEQPETVGAALARAGAAGLAAALPRGLETQLGRDWPGGVELSGGQWQRLTLGRAFMRQDPLLVVFDEPTAALDAQTEHALFESFAAAARSGESEGTVTLLVSHRFSTVRMADLIVVLAGGRIVEQGSHADLVRRGGLYAELYGLQAAAYR